MNQVKGTNGAVVVMENKSLYKNPMANKSLYTIRFTKSTNGAVVAGVTGGGREEGFL